MNPTAAHLSVPLTTTAHHWARQFALEQTTPAKAKQVYVNTLAVWAVQQWLNWLQIPTNWEQSNSWHPGMRALMDVADLVLPQLGRLECRPVMAKDTEMTVPPTPYSDLIGYVAVQFDHDLSDVKLVGFIPVRNVASENLPLTALRPLETLLESISNWETQTTANPVHLSRWRQQVFDSSWQTVTQVLGTSPSLSVRQFLVRRAKPMRLKTAVSTESVALIVTLIPASETQLGIHLQVCPLEAQTSLPPNLQLRVLTGTGSLFRQVTAKDADTFIQFEFTGELGEQFQVELVWQDAYITERFTI